MQIVNNENLIVEYSTEAYRKFHKDTYPKGTRIVLIEMKNEPNPVPKQTKGTVYSVDDAPTIYCRFDNGRCLGIIPDVDAFRNIS